MKLIWAMLIGLMIADIIQIHDEALIHSAISAEVSCTGHNITILDEGNNHHFEGINNDK